MAELDLRPPSLPVPNLGPKTFCFLGSLMEEARTYSKRDPPPFCANIALLYTPPSSPPFSCNQEPGRGRGGEGNSARLLAQLPLLALLHGGQVVDGCVLQHRQEHEHEADPEVDVYRLDVGDAGHGGVHARDDGGHGQHGGDTCNMQR